MSRFRISKIRMYGRTWYVPKRRVFLFFWTKDFKCKKGGCVTQSMRSLDVHDAVEFIVDNAKYQKRIMDSWNALLSEKQGESV